MILFGLNETVEFGQQIGASLKGGEVIELVGDVGAGKTSLVKGIALGLGIEEPIQSPTFTISRQYEARDDMLLAHYDFYRLSDAGIMREELAEAVSQPNNIVILEWATLVDGVLPEDRLTIEIESPSEDSRRVKLTASGDVSNRVMRRLE